MKFLASTFYTTLKHLQYKAGLLTASAETDAAAATFTLLI